MTTLWFVLELKATSHLFGSPIQLTFNLQDGTQAIHTLRLADHASGGLVVVPLAAHPLAVESDQCSIQVAWREVTPRLACLFMGRQLCAEDPSTLFSDPVDLQRHLQALPPDQALRRLWCRYQCWILERPRPLLAPHALEAFPLADGHFQPPPASLTFPRLRALMSHLQRRSPAPRRVSVVIPLHGKEDLTFRCLESLLSEQLRCPDPPADLEILLVDDASPPGSIDHLVSLVQGCGSDQLRLVHQSENLGYLHSCNRGASLATAELLCFLNNDTVVTPYWLSELLLTLEGFPSAGLVGPMLLYADGRLQEAGGIVWRDGSAWNYGRDGDPFDPSNSFCRDVDYVSGACLLLRRELFHRLGGFDSRFAPAYYEDTDLAMAVRELGYRVLMQPLARVIHYEGVSSGQDHLSGVKRFQDRNALLFRSKWERKLEHHANNGTAVWHERNRGRVGRVLVMEGSLPTPDRDAGSLYIFHLLTDLLALGWDVSYLPADNLLWQPDYGSALQRLGVEVLVHPWVASVEELLAARGDHYEAILIARPEVASRWLEAIKSYAPLARLLYYTHDLHHLRMERQHALDPTAVDPAAITRMRANEKHILDVVDAAFFLSEEEQRQAEERFHPRSRGFLLPPRVRHEILPGTYQQRQGVVFLGGFRHPPNADAVLWYVQAVLPALKQLAPNPGEVPHLHVVGADPPGAIQALSGAGITVHGYVPDLAPLLSRVRLCIAPLRFGAGVKGKMLTAMAAGLPLVATSVAAEGLGLRHGITARLADEPEAFAREVFAIYSSAELWERQVEAASAHLESGWGEATVRQRLAEALQAIGLPVAQVPMPLPEKLWPLPRGAGPEELLSFYNLHTP